MSEKLWKVNWLSTISGAKGATSLTATASASSSLNLLAGDIITIAGVNYVVASAVSIAASSAGTVVIGAPGLRATASSASFTITAASVRNFAFARNAIALATRLPALPAEGDSADDRVLITDPVSGITFEFAMYKLYRRVRYEVGIAYGSAVIKPEHMVLLLG